MKRKIWILHLISAVFAFVLSVSAIGNLISGYALPVDSLWKINLWCALCAIGSSLLFRFRYGGRVIIFVAVLSLFVLWKRQTLWQELQTIIFILSSHYHDVYAWPVLGHFAAHDVPQPLVIWGVLTAVSVNWYICRRKHIAVVIFPAVLPLMLCLVTTDRVPDTIYLYLLILGLAVLLVTDWTRKNQPAQGLKLILQSTLLIAASLALLFTVNPREEYINHAAILQNKLTAWFQEFQTKAESVVTNTPITAPVTEKLNLRIVGPKNRISYSVMRVNSPVMGSLYLRGRDFDQYTGTGWAASSDRNEVFTSGKGSVGEITIVTYGARNVLYVPYYAAGGINLRGGAMENEDNLQRYSYTLSGTDSGNTDIPDSRYTKLPEETLAWAKEIVGGITDDALSTQANILRIQNYVRNAAVYDLSTSRMDSDYDDFAQWFLEESETGYCVHFATAATVLLRAAGIPARYVEGYMVNASADTDVVVLSTDAHAWAEFYDSGAWHILEATPADPEDGESDPAPTVPQTETTPEETKPETENPETEPNNTEDLSTKPSTGQENSEGDAGTQNEEKKAFRVPVWIKMGLRYLFLIVCIILQGRIRMIRKRVLWNRGRPNDRTMTRWRQTRFLAKLLKQPYPEELDHLAQRAKFSQHRIQPEELQQFEDYRNSLTESLRDKPLYKRIVYKWILAIE